MITLSLLKKTSVIHRRKTSAPEEIESELIRKVTQGEDLKITAKSLNISVPTANQIMKRYRSEILESKKTNEQGYRVSDHGNRYSMSFKKKILKRILDGERAIEVATDTCMPISTISRWLTLERKGKICL